MPGAIVSVTTSRGGLRAHPSTSAAQTATTTNPTSLTIRADFEGALFSSHSQAEGLGTIPKLKAWERTCNVEALLRGEADWSCSAHNYS
jgi:hypothetical protein